MKRRIIGALITGMVNHKDEETMMRNGCLALCQFRIPQDVVSSVRIKISHRNNRFQNI